MGNVIIIGGGAAGMMAAISASASGDKVTIVEKNEKLGKKLFITGKGRCNVTNAADMDTLFKNVCTNSKFLYSAFYTFDNHMLMDFIEGAGCRLKVERGGRVFPVSDHSSDIIAAFAGELKKRNVTVRLKTEVTEIITEREENGSGIKDKKLKCVGVKLSDGRVMECDKCIVCTGGLSYPSTGSTGDGYKFAEKTGHRIVKTKAGLVPLETKESWCRELMGLSLKNVSLRMVNGKKELYSGFGEMLFTHFGVSGPLILSASSFYSGRENDNVSLYIDLKPALDKEQLDRRLLRDFDDNKNKSFKNSLSGLFPSRLIPVMTELSGIEPDKKVNEISKEERKGFLELIKGLPLTITGTRSFDEAIITRGGVSVKDIDPHTMESKLVSGLYFAGEVLDLDALTGGFNLQIAWSTGYLAGRG
ncbi:MAG: NAD(P)/FAD-dependent oxidoreductase [Lachnospiraceae bacterium]|nr:NAD(P)/FAD-dependent oxidoreductase [Lachnospiraceae bacterium]